MTPELHARGKEVFLRAQEQPSKQRLAFVRKECGSDHELIAEVESLLSFSDEIEATEASGGRGGSAVPIRIDGFTFIGVLGEGAMGTVYEAQQDHPKRTVALKVIRAGTSSRQVLRRFEHEAAILARLEHVGIARMYQAGVADLGFGPQPYFVMELVRGVQCTDHAGSLSLGTRERLELVARICDAVEHAHQRGVIHRDLKPSNILVDAGGQPKILDFGVAKAIDSAINQTMQTTAGQLVGTIPYMSPEQIEGDPKRVDATSDVYALGVIAYELLAGRLPYDLSHRTPHEALRVLSVEQPQPLSDVNRRLGGDVEVIVATAMEKDRARRYPSAAAFADDIRRYLKHEAIRARPPTLSYRARQFAKRRPVIFWTPITAFLLLAAALGGTLFALREVSNARDEAQLVAAFMTDTLNSENPRGEGGADRTVVDGIARAGQRLDQGKLQERPEVRASLLRTIAGILIANGRAAQAEALVNRSLEIERGLHRGDHPHVAASLIVLADQRASSNDAVDAERLYVQALEMDQRYYRGDSPDVVRCRGALAEFLLNHSRIEEAVQQRVLTLAMNRRLHDDGAVAGSLSCLAYALEQLGRETEALPLYEEALGIRQRLSKGDHVDIAHVLNSIAWVYAGLGDSAKSEEFENQALEMHRRLRPGDSEGAAYSLTQLGGIREHFGLLSDADQAYAEALEMTRRVYLADSPDVAQALGNLARVREQLGHAEQMERR